MLITVLPKNNTRHRGRKSEGVVDASLSIGRTSRAPDKMSKLYSSQEGEGVETFPSRGNSKCKHLELGRQEAHVPRYREDAQ